MEKSLRMLKAGFESSSSTTPEFKIFFSTFKREFTKELQRLNATNIEFSRGHFYISGFFTIGIQAWYFSLSDVRNMYYGFKHNPDSCMNKLLYRTANSYKDYTGGYNRFVDIETGMAENMDLRR
jgi:ribosomal protein L17